MPHNTCARREKSWATQFLLCSFAGDDWKLRPLEWRHWRVAVGAYTRAFICDISLRFCTSHILNLCLSFLRNVWPTPATTWGSRRPHRTKKKKTWVCCSLCIVSAVAPLSVIVTPGLVRVSPAALRGGPLPRVSGLHRGEHAAVADETRATSDFEKWQEWPTKDGTKVWICVSIHATLFARLTFDCIYISGKHIACVCRFMHTWITFLRYCYD